MFLFFDGDICVEKESNRREFMHTKEVGSSNSQQELTSAKILELI